MKKLVSWLGNFRSARYWEERYVSGGNSGNGSYGELAVFKADTINGFVRANGVNTVLELGCGDGGQLRLAEYPHYLGFDVSSFAISKCRDQFSEDSTEEFLLMSEYCGQDADLTLSLDVVYHLVEDSVFFTYMERLFDSANKFVIIYSSNHDESPRKTVPHVRHRKFTDYVDQTQPKWHLLKHIPNRFPRDVTSSTGSFADFFVYKKR